MTTASFERAGGRTTAPPTPRTPARRRRAAAAAMTPLLATAALVSAASSLGGCHARRLALRRKSPSGGAANGGVVSSSLHGFPFVDDDNLPQLESSIFLYRGGSNSDHEDELDLADESMRDVHDAEDDDDDRVLDNEADNIDQKVHTEDNIQVTSTVANAPSKDSSEATVETSTHRVERKKSNAVGDPDGNSSDDESSDMDEDELEELNELERELAMLELERQKKERQRKGGDIDAGGEAGFETLVELAERREGMKRRIAEMENELRRRKNESQDGEIDLDVVASDELGGDVADEDDDELELEEDEEGGDSSTSYHLAGTNVTREDEVLRRQRKYKRGSIFKGSTSRKRRTSNASTTKSSSNQPAKPPAVPTTIDPSTLDEMLVSAFKSMVFLPPPSPRLPSPEGSASLRNVDVSARRRLDRRTLYHGLLAELGGSHHHTQKDASDSATGTAGSSKKDNSIDSMVRRRYLDAETSRSLKGALSLACQPRWRERLMVSETAAARSVQENNGASKGKEGDDDEEDYGDEALPTWWHRGGVCLFPASDDEGVVMFEEGASPVGQRQIQRQQSFNMGPQGQGMEGNMGGDGQGGPPQGFFGPQTEEEDAAGTSPPKPWRCTMGMQETVAMALAHSLSCGLALIDDEALAGVRNSVEESLAELAVKMASEKEGDDEIVPPTINPEELRNAALLGHLVRLADEGKLGCESTSSTGEPKPDEEEAEEDADAAVEEGNVGFGKISHRMKRDMDLGLDDSNDDLAVESLRLMREDEKQWFEPIEEDAADDAAKNPLSLVLFVRSDTSPSIFRSKSAVETLAQECVKKDGIHLLMLGGKGIDASTTSLPGSSQAIGAASGRMSQQQPSMMQQQQGRAPFSFMSQFPPGSPEFNAQMAQANKQNQGHGHFHGPPGGAFGGANNPNASGMHDPEGSRRFNIFLARTVDPAGRPQIMGTIASPAAGNLFPQILANMAKENLRKIQEQGIDEDNEQQAMFVRQMEELAESAAQHMTPQQQQENSATDGGTPNTALFNATITSPFGSEIFRQMMNQDGENDGSPGEFQMPPENIRRAIQDAMWGVIDRLAQMSPSASSNNEGNSQSQFEGTSVPLNIARAFSQVLSNENLRRGIAENLSRAAPALINPHCQGVMLSVYVPPGPEHPNKGMMPGDQYKQQRGNRQMKRQDQQQQQGQHSQMEKGAGDVPHGMGGWLNKILSSSDKGKHHNEGEDAMATETADEDTVAESSTDVAKGDDAEDKPDEKESTAEQQDSPKPSKRPSTKGKRSKREKLDRARTLAVAAAALAGAKKGRKDGSRQSGGGGRPLNIKLTPEQKAERNLIRLQALCRHIPLQSPLDPVRLRSWDAWADREEGSVVFRGNRRTLTSHLNGRNLNIDSRSGTKGAGIVLRQMMSVRGIGEDEMEDVVRCAVEIEAGKSQRHHESPWGVTKPVSAIAKPTLATDKSLVNFLHDDDSTSDNSPMTTTQYIHPNSLESALSLICGVSPSPGSHGSSSSSSSGTGVMASHRSKEDLMALAQDKHERALIPNCVSPQDIGVTYDMIGGLGEVKELLRQSITYPLKFPHLYSEGIAREAVKGVLLFGPPGTGKTMLAKAVATEGGASFLSVDASSVENKWLGESEKNAKAVFTLARRLAPCVIFIDEVDSLLSSREGSSDDSAHGTLTSVKTTMMSEWDGLNSGTNGKGDAGSDRVVVIGSTNRPFDLDEAVLRRFPRRILVDLPDLETRREILEVTLAENRLGADVNLTMIAERLEGYTGSDLKEVCREAVVQISHEQARMLDRGELLDDEDEEYLETAGSGFQMLRPVTMKDFENAMRKLKRSVSETGRELAKVWDWNDEYGEIKKTSKRDALPQMMNMFL